VSNKLLLHHSFPLLEGVCVLAFLVNSAPSPFPPSPSPLFLRFFVKKHDRQSVVFGFFFPDVCAGSSLAPRKTFPDIKPPFPFSPPPPPPLLSPNQFFYWKFNDFHPCIGSQTSDAFFLVTLSLFSNKLLFSTCFFVMGGLWNVASLCSLPSPPPLQLNFTPHPLKEYYRFIWRHFFNFGCPKPPVESLGFCIPSFRDCEFFELEQPFLSFFSLFAIFFLVVVFWLRSFSYFSFFFRVLHGWWYGLGEGFSGIFFFW